MMFIVQHSATAANKNVKVMQKEGIGSYLADGNGKTLCWFKKDSPNTSNCTGACLEKWPAFFSGAMLTVSEPLKTTDFGTIDRADGKKQNTCRGYPLYYYLMDQHAGDMKGHKLNEVLFVIDPGKFPQMAKQDI
ncbi:MAG: hypothetical protein K4305_06825 [Chlorobium sp.]|uniref:COG4315 family predicted lipoprotein n=1 Tax=Chlorobium sp. TaxID=1095 RepID=UPI002F41198A